MIRNWMHTLISYLRLPIIVHADHEKNELVEEIEFHLTSSVRDNLDAGMSSQQSKQATLERFGDVSAVVRDCCEDSISRHLFWHRLHQAITVVLVCAVGFLWYQGRSKPADNSNFFEMAASGYSRAETSGDIEGTVVGSHGEPVSAAHVLAVVKTWPPNGFRQQSYMATTRADGTFVIENVYPQGQEYEVQIAAIADDRLMQSEYISMTKGKLRPLHFQLKETSPFVLRFESSEGRPIVGVRAFPFERVDSRGHRHSVYFSSADPIVRESGATGDVPMPHFLPGEQATVFIRFPNSDWQTRQLVVPTDENFVVLTPSADGRLDGG